MKIKVLYKLEKAEAIKRIKNLITELKKEHKGQISEVKEKWNLDKANFGFKMSGFKITGTIVINPKDIIINGKLPFIAIPFKSQIEKTIKQKADELLK